MKSQTKTRMHLSRKNYLSMLISTLFSAIAIVAGFSDVVYIPLSPTKAIDIIIIAVMFASMIGGYRVAIPLALVWSLVTQYNLAQSYYEWNLYSIIFVREAFTISIVFFYSSFKRIYQYSPFNVYRTIVYSILFKNFISIPFDMDFREEWMILRLEQTIIEVAVCCVFMSLLIKHLRQIHLLNGVRKRERGEKKNGN